MRTLANSASSSSVLLALSLISAGSGARMQLDRQANSKAQMGLSDSGISENQATWLRTLGKDLTSTYPFQLGDGVCGDAFPYNGLSHKKPYVGKSWCVGSDGDWTKAVIDGTSDVMTVEQSKWLLALGKTASSTYPYELAGEVCGDPFPYNSFSHKKKFTGKSWCVGKDGDWTKAVTEGAAEVMTLEQAEWLQGLGKSPSSIYPFELSAEVCGGGFPYNGLSHKKPYVGKAWCVGNDGDWTKAVIADTSDIMTLEQAVWLQTLGKSPSGTYPFELATEVCADAFPYYASWTDKAKYTGKSWCIGGAIGWSEAQIQ